MFDGQRYLGPERTYSLALCRRRVSLTCGVKPRNVMKNHRSRNPDAHRHPEPYCTVGRGVPAAAAPGSRMAVRPAVRFLGRLLSTGLVILLAALASTPARAHGGFKRTEDVVY